MQTLNHIIALQNYRKDLGQLYTQLFRLSPDVGKLIGELEKGLDLSNFGAPSGLDKIAVACGRVLELCLSLLLVTLRVGTPSTSPFDVRLNWLQKLPIGVLASPRLVVLLSDWTFSNDSLVFLGLLSPSRQNSLSNALISLNSSSSDDSISFVNNSNNNNLNNNNNNLNNNNLNNNNLNNNNNNIDSVSEFKTIAAKKGPPPLPPSSKSSGSNNVSSQTRNNGSSPRNSGEEPSAASSKLVSLRQVVGNLIRLLVNYIEMHTLLQRDLTDFCGPPPLGSKHFSKLCCFSIDGKCMRGEECPYAHSYEQIRQFYIQSSTTEKRAPEPPLSTSRLYSSYLDASPDLSSQTNSSSSFSGRLSLPLPETSAIVDISMLPPRFSLDSNRSPNFNLSTSSNSDIWSFSSSSSSSLLSPLSSSSDPSQNWNLPDFSLTASDKCSTFQLSSSSSSKSRPASQPSHLPSYFDFFEDDNEDLDDSDNSETSPQRRKTQICRHWRRSYCRLGQQCNFAHGSEDLVPFVRSLTPNTSTLPPLPPTRRHAPPSFLSPIPAMLPRQ